MSYNSSSPLKKSCAEAKISGFGILKAILGWSVGNCAAFLPVFLVFRPILPYAASRVVLHHMRRDADMAKGRNVIGGVVRCVFGNGDAPQLLLGLGFEHRFRSAAFGLARGHRDDAANGKAVTVLHQGVPHVTKLGLFAHSLTI